MCLNIKRENLQHLNRGEKTRSHRWKWHQVGIMELNLKMGPLKHSSETTTVFLNLLWSLEGELGVATSYACIRSLSHCFYKLPLDLSILPHQTLFLEHEDWVTFLAINRVGTGKIFLVGKNELLPTASLWMKRDGERLSDNTWISGL